MWMYSADSQQHSFEMAGEGHSYPCICSAKRVIQPSWAQSRYADGAAVVNVDHRSDNAMKSSLSLNPTTQRCRGDAELSQMPKPPTVATASSAGQSLSGK